MTFDFSKDMEHLNGEYEMQVHIVDINADENIIWDLGIITIGFKEGLDEGNNLGIKSEYQPNFIIKHIFPPAEPEKSLVVSYHVLWH